MRLICAGVPISDGCAPVNVSLVPGAYGDLYGTTEAGGSACSQAGCGTISKITPGGVLTPLSNFPSSRRGINPVVGLDLAADGNFYEATMYDGANKLGTIFRFTPDGEVKTLCESSPASGVANLLVQAADGNVCGTGDCDFFGHNCGTALTVLYNFNGTDGSIPSRLIQASHGEFYGTTSGGGANGDGTVFEITADGVLTTLHSFNGSDGSGPTGGVIEAMDENFPNGDFYGTMAGDGALGDGTVFKLTRDGALTTLHSLDGSVGQNPGSALVQGTDGNLCGTADMGGSSGDCPLGDGCGTVFQVIPGGALTNLHSLFGTDGGNPLGSGLVQGTDGSLYGVTDGFSASAGSGSIVGISVGLEPFVKLMPPGATTGKVRVATPNGMLLSGGPFLVRP
jgi:uncharacterized repeat protein (TIGR03803 family)